MWISINDKCEMIKKVFCFQLPEKMVLYKNEIERKKEL